MAKKFVYFQPEYVNRFKCNGCTGGGVINCCERDWDITIDDAIYKKYRKIKPSEKAQEILSHIVRDDKRNSYMLIGRPCPFLTPEKFCGIQLNYGEEFLSQTCATYPRRTHKVGNFFERSLTLTCPVAAEMILFAQEPLKFEFIEVPDKIHGKHGRIQITKVPIASEKDASLAREIQITMISILQRRLFTIDQRLIALGLFLDKLQELVSAKSSDDTLLDLIAAYRSEDFLTEEISPIFQSFAFDAKSFVTFMIKFIGYTLEALKAAEGKKFLDAFVKVLEIHPDKNNLVYLPQIVANFEKLSDARKNFSEKYSAFLENYLVNELFYGFYPWRFITESLTKNFIVFLISFKIFELMTFATVQSGLDSKEDLLAMVDWFMMKTDHNPELYKRFFELLEGVDDTYLLMATLL